MFLHASEIILRSLSLRGKSGDMKYLSRRDFIWILPLSLGLGVVLSFLQPGNWLIGWLGFSFLFLLSLSLLTISTRWAGGDSASFSMKKNLAWMVAFAFALRLAGGVATFLVLPINGFDDVDDKAGYVYKDAHRRDDQAWELAVSGDSVLGVFNKKYAYDQYGGLLSLSAFVYRYLSPDAHRPLMLVLFSAFMAALGLPFLFKAAGQQWGEKVGLASSWIYTLYPESVLLGGSAMREPYLWACSAFALWGFVDWQKTHSRNSWFWLGLGLAGMLLVSPIAALITLVIFAGWLYFVSEQGRISWWMFAVAAVVFVAGLFILSSALDRQGNLGGGTPFSIINNFVRESLNWNIYKIKDGSGWVQKLFNQMPEYLHLPFVMVYGVFQPVLPAAVIEPTTLIWRIIAVLRALGWYVLLPALILSFVAGAGSKSASDRKLWLWLSVIVWGWVLMTALRGGGDQWDNPRYRAILLVWQAIVAGHVWVWWRETRTPWFGRVFAMEAVFVFVFGLWYVNRYYQIGFQLEFAYMVVIIPILWALILFGGWWKDRIHRIGHGV